MMDEYLSLFDKRQVRPISSLILFFFLHVVLLFIHIHLFVLLRKMKMTMKMRNPKETPPLT